MAYFIRVDAGTEVAYELVADPTQKQQAREPQAEVVVEQASSEVTNPADLQGKPRSITPTFSNQCYYLKYCALSFLGVE